MPANHHNSALRAKLHHLLTTVSADTLSKSFSALSNAEQKAAGHLLSHELLPALSAEAYRSAFLALVPHHPKAYLVTFLLAATQRHAAGTLSLLDPLFADYAHTPLTPIDCQKALTHLLPLCSQPEEADHLLRLFAPTSPRLRIAHLLRCTSAPAAYALFLEAKREEADIPLLKEVSTALRRRGDDLALRLASLLQSYFSLPGPTTTRPLLEPYQLSQLEGGYPAFLKIVGATSSPA